MIKRIHYISGITLTVFIAAHLTNHLAIFSGQENYLWLMEKLRMVYRNPIIEGILLVAVITQVFSGMKLWRKLRSGVANSSPERYQILSGLYLAFFLLVHVSAVLSGRIIFELDTNLYFGAMGMNFFPFYIFFVPYYFLAVAAIFGHVACIHYRKTNKKIQAQIIFGVGVVVAILIIFGMISNMTQADFPKEYLEPYGL